MSTSDNVNDIEAGQLATMFFSDTLKNYVRFKKNHDLLSRMFVCCDKCLIVRPKWGKLLFHKHNDHNDVVFCNDCLLALDENDRPCYSQIEFKTTNGGLY